MPDLIGHLLSFRAKSRNLLFSAAAREKRDYQNRRAAHLEALWGIVDWSVIEERYNH